MRRSTPVLTALSLLALGAGAGGQDAPPSFGKEVEVVTVDAVVIDKAGNPVPGLTREDFTVLDEGVPQTLVNFEVVEAGEQRVAAAPEAPPPPKPRWTLVIFQTPW